MNQYICTTLAAVLLLLPVAVQAETQTSPSYTINAGRVVSGGGSAADVTGMSKSGIAIGQGVFIPPAGVSSPGYTVKVVAEASPASGGIHSGDINSDGRVDINDALLALKAGIGLVQLSNAELLQGDVGPLVNNVPVGDGRIDIEDAILILRKAVGLGW
jgi:hypothetical protein